MLKTNYVPLESEVELIRQLITGKMEELSRLEEQITHFPDIVDNLTRERDTLNEYIRDHRALISGARRVPRDVLEEVFVLCLPADQNAKMRTYESPVLLGRICSAWREVSLTSPRLWSSLHVDADPRPDAKLQHRVEAAESWLNRSGSLLLSISFTVSHEGPQSRIPAYELPKIQQLMDVFNACSRRWRSLHLSMTMSSFLTWSPTLTAVDVPVLEALKLELIESYNMLRNASALPMILQAQSLRTISLSDAMSYPSIFAPYWGQLTTLSLLCPWGTSFGLTWQNALVILHHASNLRKFSLQLSPASSPSVRLPQGVITLLSLESFRIDVADSNILMDFLNVLAMPSLKHLAISSTYAGLFNIPFISLLTKPQVIETMELKLNAFPSDYLIRLLALVPSLRGLCLAESVHRDYSALLNDEVIKRLTPDADGHCLCPCLEEVRVCSAHIRNEGLHKFLQTRTQSEHLGVTRLQRAVLAFARWGRLVDFDAKRLHENSGYMPDYVLPITDYHWRRFNENFWKKGWAHC
jgi:hypothetical protein